LFWRQDLARNVIFYYKRRSFFILDIRLALKLLEIKIIAKGIFGFWKRLIFFFGLSAFIISLFRILNVFIFNSYKRRFILIIHFLCLRFINLFIEKISFLFFRKSILIFFNWIIFWTFFLFFSYNDFLL
jgi:hypothetical protein